MTTQPAQESRSHQCGWGLVEGEWRCVQDFYARGHAPGTSCGATWDPTTATITRPEAEPRELSRWEVNRSRGIRQGWVDETGDRLSKAAEDHVGQMLGVPTVGVLDGKSDPGWDMVYRGLKLDVKHTQHEHGHLAVAWRPELHADAYVLVTGRSEAAFLIRGWASRDEVLAGERVDHGYEYRGKRMKPYYRVRRELLHPMHELGVVVTL